MSIYRNLDGFSDVAQSDPLGALPFLDPTRWAVDFEDFLRYDLAQETGHYVLTQTNGVDTIAGPTGVLLLTLGGADNDVAELQGAVAPWQTQTGKKLLYEARVKVAKGAGGTIGQEELFFGLATIQTTTNFMNAGGTALAVDACMGFVSYDASTSLSPVNRVADVESIEAGAASYADDTWMVLSLYHDGSSTKFYKDGTLLGDLAAEPTTVMTPTLFVKAGGAHAKVLHCDYYLVAAERG